jgi:two-component system chemotaxis response regulator CheB
MDKKDRANFRAIVIGVSAGGVAALKKILGDLPIDFAVPVIVVQHTAAAYHNALASLLDNQCEITVKEAEECERVQAGIVYVAPANYHLLVEQNGTLSLSTDPPILYARPSIDVLFESAAMAYGPGLIGIILTGANADGSQGLKKVKEKGGIAIVQDPADAQAPNMPLAALAAVKADFVVPLSKLGVLLNELLDKPAHILE